MADTDSTFPPGAPVKIRGTRISGEVLSGPGAKNSYLISAGPGTISVPASELEPLLGEAPSRRKPRSVPPVATTPNAPSEIRLDLHGCTVPDALQRLESAISQALLAGASRLEVIHGIGTGALRTAVTSYLAHCPHITRHGIDPRNPGTTLVVL